MNISNIQLNTDQQNALELLKSNCKKVELYFNTDGQKEAMCLLEDKKVIEVTFYSESKLCVTYNDFEDNCAECQECFYNHELDNSVLDRLFERVVNSEEHLQHFGNQSHAQKIREFLK